MISVLLGLGLICLLIGTAGAGGWAVATLESWPGTVVANEPFTVRYALRGHGQALLSADQTRENANIRAVHQETGEWLEFAAQPAGKVGYYEAELLLPAAGTWDWTIHDFGTFPLPPLMVAAGTAVPDNNPQMTSIAISSSTINWFVSGLGVLGIVAGLFLWFRRGAKFGPVLGLVGAALLLLGLVFLPANQVETAVAQPAAIEPSAEMGAILFQTKGCVTCHQHAEVSYEGMRTNMGPNLTRPKVTPEFLRMWLSDPAQVRPETQMPNLELADEEIEALIAFLVEE